ncbi:putative ATPase [Aequitasia blattaphilus]|uniref:ATP-binding protein n=1 Tax=Aequitasia blattaphilus TaxID=2949332 RepID=A0ABT1E8B8_9FIRM|nr:ATP-binding protein [Aequitasia blattaphilus]MCP1102080.1 ATP-binding protein [Aequitasia blattaphilus]MCR8614720.1 ATP-binding protein [Aequitasia blattaphilus]
MKILKIKASGLPLFGKDLEIDFFAKRRVETEQKDDMYNLFSNIYINNALAFIGVNAAGKTTVLKVITFVLEMIRNEPINRISSKHILEGIEEDGAEIETFFYCNEQIYKLKTIIKSEQREEKTYYKIEEETIWSKNISKVRTKEKILDFENMDTIMKRNNNEEFLLDDVSTIVAFNKKYSTKVYTRDMLQMTNLNLISRTGDFPEELITYLDPSVEYIRFEIRDKKNFDIKLKFHKKEEIVLDSPLKLNDYLSSGTIKGISVFMNVADILREGGYLIIDELENHFNTEIVFTLIRFFNNRKVNKNGATLLFSTHYAELLDEFNRNDGIYIVRNRGGVTVENLSDVLKRNDIKKSDAYQSDFLQGTAPSYEAYMGLRKYFINHLGGE